MEKREILQETERGRSYKVHKKWNVYQKEQEDLHEDWDLLNGLGLIKKNLN